MAGRVIVVDSSVWISLFRRHENRAVDLLVSIPDKTRILVGDIVLLEVLQGARDERHAERLERTLRSFAITRFLDAEIGVRAAFNYRLLRGLGRTMRTSADLIIATYCITYGHKLLHDDRDFSVFEQHLGLHCL